MSRHRYVELFAWVATATVFGVDTLLPPGFAISGLYIGVILAALWIPRRWFIGQYTAVATGLNVLGLFLTTDGGYWHFGVINRLLSVGALWITAGGITIYRREAAAREALQARLHAQAALVELGKMAAAIAHEVRNAVTGVSASIELLHRTTPPATSADDEVCDLARRRLARLGEMVDDLLAFVNLRSIAFAPVQVRTVVDEAIALARDRSDDGDVPIRLAIDDVTIDADHDALRRALFNLIVNAAQATPPNGDVTIRAAAEDGRCRIEVVDQGSGVSAAVRARLFEPFVSTRTHGVGLGLAFVKRVVAAHHGTVELTSSAAHGTVAALDLPLATPAREVLTRAR